MYTCRMSISAVESGIALAGTALATDELTQEHINDSRYKLKARTAEEERETPRQNKRSENRRLKRVKTM